MWKYISSQPPLDVLNALITLACEFVTIFYLDETAHSAFWFMVMLTIVPVGAAFFSSIAACTPFKCDDMLVGIATAIVMNTCFAYFCSGSAGNDPVTGEQLMGFGPFKSLVPPVFFGITGGIQVLIPIITYVMSKPCGDGEETSCEEDLTHGVMGFCQGVILTPYFGMTGMLYGWGVGKN